MNWKPITELPDEIRKNKTEVLLWFGDDYRQCNNDDLKIALAVWCEYANEWRDVFCGLPMEMGFFAPPED